VNPTQFPQGAIQAGVLPPTAFEDSSNLVLGADFNNDRAQKSSDQISDSSE
jgi:hypothetical protein